MTPPPTTPRGGRTPRRSGFHPEWTSKRRGPKGRPLCKRCLAEVPAPRRWWCGDACVEAYCAQSDPAALRRLVERRDREVCALCGLDAALLARVVARLWERDDRQGVALRRRRSRRDRLARLPRWSLGGRPNLDGTRAADLMEALGFHAKDHSCLWEADHIVPLVEGGAWGPENVRTLCRRCHRKQTAALARRRAEVRSGVRLPNGAIPLPEPTS